MAKEITYGESIWIVLLSWVIGLCLCVPTLAMTLWVPVHDFRERKKARWKRG